MISKDVVIPDWAIETPRLVLRVLPPAALAALVAGEVATASRIAGCELADFPAEEYGIAERRRKDLAEDPHYLPWSLRAIQLKPTLDLVGHCNFHTRPDPAYLKELAPGAVELGYFILPAYRRRGLAEETVCGLMDWAGRVHGITRFVISVSPENGPSVAMARKLGFAKIGSHIDQEDGYEAILARAWLPAG
jgi:[ribosomal protein S5]-alanine N-acetyltransferase